MKILILGQQTIFVHNKLWIYQFHYMPFGWSKLQTCFVRGGGAIICAQGSNLKVDNIYPHTQWITLCIIKLSILILLFVCLLIHMFFVCHVEISWTMGLTSTLSKSFIDYVCTILSSSWHLDKIGWDMEFLNILVATCMLSK